MYEAVEDVDSRVQEFGSPRFRLMNRSLLLAPLRTMAPFAVAPDEAPMEVQTLYGEPSRTYPSVALRSWGVAFWKLSGLEAIR